MITCRKLNDIKNKNNGGIEPIKETPFTRTIRLAGCDDKIKTNVMDVKPHTFFYCPRCKDFRKIREILND
jgi:hypothetical protein